MDRFSVDLVALSRAHYLFLLKVHKAGISLRQPTEHEFMRYEQLWLPLLASLDLNDKDLVLCPPLDIAWLWHCHRLAPASYRHACQTHFKAQGALDCPRAAFLGCTESDLKEETSDVSLAATATKVLWQSRYPDDDFLLKDQEERSSQLQLGPWKATPQRGYGCIGKFDVIESAERQSSFLWQVSGEKFLRDILPPHAQEKLQFLEDGVMAYWRFLELMRLKPKAFLVPTYQIDLMWHTHILSSVTAYETDCTGITGNARPPDHDDSVNDRSTPETKLNISSVVTRQLWREAFGKDSEAEGEWAVPGGMYRGEPPSDFWQVNWLPSQVSLIESSGSLPLQFKACRERILSMLLNNADNEDLDLGYSDVDFVDGIGGMAMHAPTYAKNRAVKAAGGAPPIMEADAIATEIAVTAGNTRSMGAEPVPFQVEAVVEPIVDGAAILTPTYVNTANDAWTIDRDKFYGLNKFVLMSFGPEFIPGNPRNSVRRGENPNPHRPGYVFGAQNEKDLQAKRFGHRAADGYYRLDTSGADEIVCMKLQKRLNTLKHQQSERYFSLQNVEENLRRTELALQEKDENFQPKPIICCSTIRKCCLYLEKNDLLQKRRVLFLEQTEIDVLTIMLANKDARVHGSKAPPDMNKSNNGAGCGAACGGFFFYEGGDRSFGSGGCGATGAIGGGCGSGSCGGGSCGGGGCGGGGCGGGGCGGGGCGGGGGPLGDHTPTE